MALFKQRGKHAKGVKPQEATEAMEPAQGLAPKSGEEGQADATAADELAPGTADAPEGELESMPEGETEGSGADDALAGFDKDAEGYPLDLDTAQADAFVAAGIEIPKKRRHRALKALGITAGALAGLALVAYIAGAVVFMGRFVPNTALGPFDVSMKTDAEVVELLQDAVNDYLLDVVSDTGFSYRTTGPKIGMTVDAATIVANMHADLNAWSWPALLVQSYQGGHDETSKLSITYKRSSYEDDVTERIAAYNETATPPTDATIVFDEKADSFKVQAEVPGTQYSARAVLAAMRDAISSLSPKVELGSDELIAPAVLATDEKLVEAADLATGMVSAKITLVLDGTEVDVISGEDLSAFISIDEKIDVRFDEEGMNDWVRGLAEGFNTVGSERSYTRPDGKQVTISEGDYGWEIDADALRDVLLEGIKSGSVSTVEIPCEQTAQVYNGPGQPDWGNRYIDVDLSEQYVRFYGDDGSLIWESACISGSPDGKHNTWPGVWYITNKESPSKLVGYTDAGKKEYETTVSYWMAFEGNAIGLHDATWQPSFGGSMYANGYGSHGCVNLPYSAAQELYGLCDVNDVVIAHF